MTLAEVHVKWSVIFTDLLGPDISPRDEWKDKFSTVSEHIWKFPIGLSLKINFWPKSY